LPALRELIINTIDFFHPPFRYFMDRKTFRYMACGGGNTLLDIFIYFISYNFVLKKEVIELPFVAISPHIGAFIIAFSVTFPIGFLLMRYVVFPDSTVRGRIQLVRYFLMVAVCILLNYVFLKLFVEQFHFYPTIAKILTTFIVVAFSYLSQRHFTFKAATVKG
jgi:putative flippase GtrA